MTAAMKRDYPIQPRKDIMSPQSFNSVPPNPSGPIPPPVHLYYPYGCYPQVHPAGPLPLMNHGTSPGMGSNDIQLARHPHGSLLPQQTSPYSVAGGPDPTQEKRNAKTAASKSQPSSPERLHSTPYRGDSGSAKSSRNTPVDNNIQSRDGPSNWRPGHSPYSYPQQHLPPYCAEAQWGNIRDHPPPHHPRGPPPPYHHWAGAPHPPPLPHGMYGGLPSHPPPHLPPQMHSRDGRSAYWPNHPVSNRSTGGPLDPAGTGGPGARGPVASAVVHRKDKLMPQNPTSSLQVGPPVTSSDAFTNEVDGREGATSPTQIEIHHRDEVENMGCTCKKTNCLKLYCQCFGIRIYCGANCRCKDCFNDSKHEKERKEAMRNIISRNPSAFDTKFKKTGQPAVAVASSEIPPEKSRVLAHKLGCKCRKSNCMKKYCECYAASVKCNATCRCVGCKNMGDGTAYDYRDNTPSRDMHATSSYEAPNQQLSQHEQPSQTVVPSILSQQAGEPWLAAQNLAFLKRGSPASELKRPALFKLKSSSGDIASMPSLASSSDGTSPGDGVASKYSALEEDESGADALLMAAVAMTEFGQSPPPRLQYLDSIATRSTPDSIIGTEPRSELPCSPEASHVRHYHPDFYQRSDDSNVESRRHSPPSKRSLDFDNVIQHQTGKRSKEEDS